MASQLVALFPVRYFFNPIQIFVLQGVHFSHESSSGMIGIIRQLFENAMIHTVDEEKLESSMMSSMSTTSLKLSPSKTMVVFPGAITIQDWHFSDDCKKMLIKKNQEGDLLLVGICAGAFFLSQQSVYNKKERDHDHYIDVFKGRMTGPVMTSFQDVEQIGYPIDLADIQVGEDSPIKVAVSGGGWFTPDSSLVPSRDYQVLARYTSLKGRPIAALACTGSYGSFRTLLIGPHFEYEREDLEKVQSLQPKVKEIIPDLESSRNARLKAMIVFFKSLGLR